MHFSNEYTLKTFTKWTKKMGQKLWEQKFLTSFKM